jgi:ATP-binding cassette subfamily B protein
MQPDLSLLTALIQPAARSLRRILSLTWQASPGWTVLAAALMIAEIGFGLAVLYLIKRLVDVLTASLDGAGGDISAALMWVALTGACSLAYLAARGFAGVCREAQGLEVADYVDFRVHDAAVRADLAFFESPRYFDTLRRARQAGNQRPAQVVGNLLLLAKSAVMLLAVIALIATIHPLLLPLLAVATLPMLWARMRFTRRLYDWDRQATQDQRRAGYLDWLMTTDQQARELRQNRIGELLRDRYAQIRGRLRRARFSIHRRQAGWEFAAGLISTLLFFAALAWLVRQTAAGQNSIGDLVLFLMVFQRAQSTGQELVRQISRFFEDRLYIDLLFEFLGVRPSITAPERPTPVPEPGRAGFRFEGVSFTYPGTTATVLSNIDLQLRPGKITALVGANGSGKTTLIKLLCRLYDPDEGRITLEGVDIRDFEPIEYRAVLGVVFQDFARYALSARDNIHFGEVRQPASSERLADAARRASADEFLDGLAQGFDTPLSRMFDGGQELSIGQWQRIALARALFSERTRLIVLDEPSSALDPAAEAELFENLRERIEQRSGLIISHRLSTLQQADQVCVLEAGRIVERGSHDELLSGDSRYARLFEQQGRFYRQARDG